MYSSIIKWFIQCEYQAKPHAVVIIGGMNIECSCIISTFDNTRLFGMNCYYWIGIVVLGFFVRPFI